MRIRVTSFLLLAGLLTATGCTFRGIPSHGGGKRFYEEQEILSAATRDALKGLSWDLIRGKRVVLTIYSIGDEGGGAGGGGGLGVGGFAGFGWSDAQPKQGTVEAAGLGAGMSNVNPYVPYAFANARDIDYLKGVAAEMIMENEGALAGPRTGDADGEVILIVNNFGTNEFTQSYVVVWTDYLKSQVSVDGWFVDYSAAAGTEPITRNMKDGRAGWSYSEFYVFGIGPIGGAVLQASPVSARLGG